MDWDETIDPGIPNHLNIWHLRIESSPGKGRGVFASRILPMATLVDISPALLISAEEYVKHGKHTVLDDYTFKWPDGRMALALGLGSLFNHSDNPNVSFTLDALNETIRFKTTRVVNADEELCIFYGHNLWFCPTEGPASTRIAEPRENDPLEALPGLEAKDASEKLDEIIPETKLPFTRIKIVHDLDENENASVKTVQAWVVDVTEPKLITTMLKWLKQSGLESPDLAHLKRIRKHENCSTLLLTTLDEPPALPGDLGLAPPYQLPVPTTSAPTRTLLAKKSEIWPTIYTPRRKNEPETWTRAKVKWASACVGHLKAEALKAKSNGELPIVAHIPKPFERPDDLPFAFTSHDSRTSTRHPLRHATLNVIRQLADHQASRTLSESATETDAPGPEVDPSTKRRNGNHYLLTSLSVFVTHEPCIMCSMALLHSRVKEVFYLIPMSATGGCGGSTCLPKLEGVNHRFGINVWRAGQKCRVLSEVDSALDA